MGNWGLTGAEGCAMGAAGVTGVGVGAGAGAGLGGGAIVCGGRGGGVLQPVNHKARVHRVQAKSEVFRKWAMA